MPQAQSKHQTNSAQTRDRLIKAAQTLYAERGIDAVSFNEITVAAGQKNRNALQYHFGNRESLLQAIIDKHASVIYQLRREYLNLIKEQSWTASRSAAYLLVMPIADYVASNGDGVEYIKIVAQLAVVNLPLAGKQTEQQILLARDKDFAAIMNQALSKLTATEAKRRIFLAVGFAFHSIADVYRASAQDQAPTFIKDHKKMTEQIVIAIDAMFAALAD